MNRSKPLTDEIHDYIQKTINEQGFILYDIEVLAKEEIFRINIFSQEKAISLDDCTKVHKAIYPYLEQQLIVNDYTIETSSVGIERPLTQKIHYQYALHQKIKLKTKANKKITGILQELHDKSLHIVADNNHTIKIAFNDIVSAITVA